MGPLIVVKTHAKSDPNFSKHTARCRLATRVYKALPRTSKKSSSRSPLEGSEICHQVGVGKMTLSMLLNETAKSDKTACENHLPHSHPVRRDIWGRWMFLIYKRPPLAQRGKLSHVRDKKGETKDKNKKPLRPSYQERLQKDSDNLTHLLYVVETLMSISTLVLKSFLRRKVFAMFSMQSSVLCGSGDCDEMNATHTGDFNRAPPMCRRAFLLLTPSSATLSK